MENNRFLRQLGLIDPSKLPPKIGVIGAGASGSFSVFALAKMGCPSITVFDFDTVSEHNIPNQVFGPVSVGTKKVRELGEFIQQTTGLIIEERDERLESTVQLEGFGVVVCCVDNITFRKQLVNLSPMLARTKRQRLVIDPRQGGESIQVFSVDSRAAHRWSDYEDGALFDEEEALPIPCTAQATSYNSMMTGSIVAVLVKQYALGQIPPYMVTVDLAIPEVRTIAANP